MDERLLQQQIQTFVRLFGLLEQEHTPCQYPLSPSQAHAMQTLAQQERLSLHQLAEQLHLEKSTVSRLVTTLVERGWVERSTNLHNRREVRLQLTAAGRAIADEVRHSASVRYQAIWQRLSDPQRAQVVDSLAILNAVLREGQENNASNEVQE
ncbi:MAG TPA: MarR family transcriptional regulator [Ktedonobacterales bacterium]|jgi:DNA-binding MarR family transcriptional regulator|nr:MarR family transcriptional regulator [Ktedonobacterales bacterium]